MNECYICYGNDSKENPLIKKGCQCKNTYVHESCLTKFKREKRDIYNCEVCLSSHKTVLYEYNHLNINMSGFITSLFLDEQMKGRNKDKIVNKRKVKKNNK